MRTGSGTLGVSGRRIKCQLPQEHGKCYSDKIVAECLFDLSSRIRGASGIERKSILWGS
jgi:hypothetical protein